MTALASSPPASSSYRPILQPAVETPPVGPVGTAQSSSLTTSMPGSPGASAVTGQALPSALLSSSNLRKTSPSPSQAPRPAQIQRIHAQQQQQQQQHGSSNSATTTTGSSTPSSLAASFTSGLSDTSARSSNALSPSPLLVSSPPPFFTNILNQPAAAGSAATSAHTSAANPPVTPSSPSFPPFVSSPQSSFAGLGAGDPIHRHPYPQAHHQYNQYQPPPPGSSTFSSPGRKSASSPRPSFGIEGSRPNVYSSALSRPTFAYSQHHQHHLHHPQHHSSNPPPGSSGSGAPASTSSSSITSNSNVHLATLSRPTSPDSNSSSAYAYTNANSQAFRNVHGSTTSSISSSSLAPSATIASSASAASSRCSSRSRRPSLVTLQSYLEGVNHVTRVRSRSLRGHSRSTSFEDATSLAGSVSGIFGFPAPTSSSSTSGERSSSATRRDGASTPWHLDDVDEMPAWEESAAFLTPSSPTPRRPANGLYSRNPSAVSLRRSALFTNDLDPSAGSMAASPMPIRRTGHHTDYMGADDEEDDDDLGERTFVDRREMALFPKHQGVMMDDEDEERHLRNLEESGWSEHELNLLQEGDRLGIGLEHEGYPIVNALEPSSSGPGANAPSPFSAPHLHPDGDEHVQFEIVRQLGYGSYAIVYLVKEVLYDHTADYDEDETTFRHDEDQELYPDGDDSYHSSRTVYGREFALKCLCKKNLTEEQIAVQRFEATLHSALPNHPNVVALHKAFETPAWLYLVLEYCPGQDLYFWLEQARDVEGIEGEPSRAPSRLSSTRPPLPQGVVSRALHHAGGSTVLDPPLGESPAFGQAGFNEKEHTPPSPSLLAANADNAILSRRRLRLISRMFAQMCEALQTCHDAGVSHRDIKPENIIIVDSRAEMGISGKVAIKITDWGLGTTDVRCEDFDCGSKPYMAYECRNNLQPSYEPKAADVWSLGVVLLNLLFHRCPWADPTLDDPDFCAYRRNPVEFFETRFEGIGNEVATFLATRIFCEVDEDDPNHQPRVTAGEFGKWANKLVRYMGEGSRRASISDATVQIAHTIRQSPRLEGSRLVHSPQHRSPRHTVELHAVELDGSPSRRLQSVLGLPPDDLVEELNGSHVDGQEVGEDSTASRSLEGALQELELDEEGHPVEGGTVAKTRRRKRGARRKHKHGHSHSEQVSATEPVSPALSAQNNDDLEEVSQGLQALAREISQATKSANASPGSSALHTPSLSQEASIIKSRAVKSRFSDRFKGAFANGNSDLQAFTERAKQRELALTGAVSTRNPTASAPAKLQQASFNAVDSGISSVSSVNSTGSWSEEGRNGSHWASTGSRRERVNKRPDQASSSSHDRAGRSSRSGYHHYSSLAGPPFSATVSASSSPSRNSFTPASSFSSTTSFESRAASRPPKTSLQPIDESVPKSEQPAQSTKGFDHRKDTSQPHTDSNLQPAPLLFTRVPQPPAPEVIRQPVQPPVEQAAPSAPPAAKAKLGRLFGKFSRG